MCASVLYVFVYVDASEQRPLDLLVHSAQVGAGRDRKPPMVRSEQLPPKDHIRKNINVSTVSSPT